MINISRILKLLLFLPALYCYLPANAQQTGIVRVTASYDPNAVPELYNQVPIGLQLTYNDSSYRQTTGYLRGNYRWNKLNIKSNNGAVQNGILSFNRAQLVRDNYRIILTVITEENVSLQTNLELPRLTGIRFNHYADSIKRDIHFYLNVEGKFSSGKVFPLDTATIRFAASDGKLIGQDLLLPKEDTTKTVIAEAWYKYNNQMYLRSVIPVKQATEDESLIMKNGQDLYNNNKRRRRQ